MQEIKPLPLASQVKPTINIQALVATSAELLALIIDVTKPQLISYSQCLHDDLQVKSEQDKIMHTKHEAAICSATKCSEYTFLPYLNWQLTVLAEVLWLAFFSIGTVHLQLFTV